MFIAMKYEEIYPPELLDWVDIKYKNQILKWEAKILVTLDFKLIWHTL